MVMEIIIYLIIGVGEYSFFNKMGVLAFVMLFYLLPLVITGIFTFIEKKNMLMVNLTSSAVAFLNYVMIGYLVGNNGMWIEFAKRNTQNMGDSWVKVSSNMISSNQIVFVLILYFAIGYLIYYINIKLSGGVGNGRRIKSK
ncbi:MAG: Msa family membrane protein [Ligilactobacillus agilis]|uniref:Msa family membrane protein n=1 Tax=Ligilactobacillus agilis TaxID=1601 RepID=UPI002432D2C3|nr:Msa family membrane protein [Ligilactobacillus agilis]MCI5760933.1 Msa family membrane protein [Ligilactobacillus agilis]MDY4065683.1 Msa family membrane protein [Ligilactobacillus agilis]